MAEPIKQRAPPPASDTRDPRAIHFVPSHRASIVHLRHKSIISRGPPVMSNSHNGSRNPSQSHASVAPVAAGRWRNLFCIEPSDDVRACCLAFWLPYMSYGQTDYRVKRPKSQNPVENLSPQETAEQTEISRQSSHQQPPSWQQSSKPSQPPSYDTAIDDDELRKVCKHAGCNEMCLVYALAAGMTPVCQGKTL
jgi:hypothetical protein